MMSDNLVTCLVTGRMTLPDGAPVPEATVDFALTCPDWDGVILPPEKVSAPVDAAGRISVPLWPNSRGAQGSRYKVHLRYWSAAFSAVTAVPLGDIKVPEAETADLATLLDLPPAVSIGESIPRQVLNARDEVVAGQIAVAEDREVIAAFEAQATDAAAAAILAQEQAMAAQAVVQAAALAAEGARLVAVEARNDALAAQESALAARESALAARDVAVAAREQISLDVAATASDRSRVDAVHAAVMAGIATEMGVHIYHDTAIASGAYPAARHLRAGGVLDHVWAEMISGTGKYVVMIEAGGVMYGPWNLGPDAPVSDSNAGILVGAGENVAVHVGGLAAPGELVIKMWGNLS